MPLMGALGEIYDLFADDEDDDFDAMMRKLWEKDSIKEL